MIPADAIAIVTPHGRYERVLRGRRTALPCGHHTAMNEIAWKRDTKTQDAELPGLVCNACMGAWVAAFAGREQKGDGMTMAHDELQRDPGQLIADFIEHTNDACRDLRFYSEWCCNRGITPDPLILNFANVLVGVREAARGGVDDQAQLLNRPNDRFADWALDMIGGTSSFYPPDPRADR